MIDIGNPHEELRELSSITSKIMYGFDALAIDYGFYVKNTFGPDKQRIHELRDNVSYRFRSAEFQYYMLLRHRHDLGLKFGDMLKTNPRVFEGFYPSNPHFDNAADEIMAIYDSIIFHLSSSFDYLSMMVNYVFGQEPDSRMKWGNLVKSCGDKKNYYSNFSFAQKILDVNREFVSKFNDYRGELIHRQSSNAYAKVYWSSKNKEIKVKFECCQSLVKNFKNILDKNEKYSLAYLSRQVIERAIQNLAHILNAIRVEFEENWKMKQEPGKLITMYIEPETGKISSPSHGYWEKFDEYYSTI